MEILNKLKIKLFADGANIDQIIQLNDKNYIKGFTTNPSLMKKSGVQNYKGFAKDLLKIVTGKPISFEIFADDFLNMEKQANEIASWGKNVFVKIPVTNTKGESCAKLIKKLSDQGVSCNVTAIFTLDQTKEIISCSNNKTPLILSIFAGRIADTGIDPSKIISEAVNLTTSNHNLEILWASTREILNIFQAENLNCDIITVPNDLLNKLNNLDKNLEKFSRETVTDFFNDAKKAGFEI